MKKLNLIYYFKKSVYPYFLNIYCTERTLRDNNMNMNTLNSTQTKILQCTERTECTGLIKKQCIQFENSALKCIKYYCMHCIN